MRVGAADMQQEESPADVISMHSLTVVALSITNIWQSLFAYTLVYTHGCDTPGSSMFHDG